MRFGRCRMSSPLYSILVFTLCVGAAYGQQQGSLKISGSSTIQPLAEMMVGSYEKSTGRRAQVEGGGSGAGIKNALSGASDIGMVSRALSAAESAQLRHTVIGYDALVFIVHASNPLAAMDLGLARSVFSGKVKSWKDLNGRDEPILTVNKEIGRSTLELFEGYSGLLHPGRGKDGPSGKIELTHQIGSNLEMATIVGGIPSAIGYVSFGTARDLQKQGMPIKILELDGKKASEQSILDGTYPILRELNLVYLSARPELMNFVSLFATGQGRQAVESLGFISSKQ